MRTFAKLMKDFGTTAGLEMVEYAVVAFAIIVTAYAIFKTVGSDVNTVMGTVNTALGG